MKSQAATNQPGAVAAPRPQKSASRFSVVIVEDDEPFRANLEAWVDRDPRFTCVGSYADGPTAWREICLRKPDVAVVDYGLPGLRGDELIRLIKAFVPAVKCLGLSGVLGDSVVLDLMHAAADGFLEKAGLTPAAFLTQLERLIAGGHPLSERAANLLFTEYAKNQPKPEIMELLTPREREVAVRKCRGLSSEAIAGEFGVSIWTIRTHERDIYRKLQVGTRAQLQFKLYGFSRRV
jgi:DNA-binding NarL/FixJ family response regulator